MKQKSKNRFFAALLAAAMMFQLLPLMVFAEEGGSESKDVAWIGDTGYKTLRAAVEAAPANGSTTTITLGEGEYTLYGIPSDDTTKNKNLTFVGQGAGLTTWKIGYPDSDKKSMYNADFSFENSGKITFQDMTLKADASYDYLGFAHTTDTVVENCVVEGMTFYWGYNSATFKDTTFKPDGYKYALWAYCSKDTIFDHCKFEGSGKAIYAHNEGNPLIKIHFKDCEVTNSLGSWGKSALNVHDGPCSFKIYISGDNKVSAHRDSNTCSMVYGFASDGNNGKTEVYYGEENENPELVWQNGKMVTHKHSDGDNDNAYKVDPTSEWENKGDHFERKVTKTCDYCGRVFPDVTEKGYQLSYELNGGTDVAGVYDSKIYPEGEKATVAATPTKEGCKFAGWKDGNTTYVADATMKVTKNTTLTASWEADTAGEDSTPAGGSGGEITAVIVAAGTAVIGYYAGTGLLMHHYGLPYWPKNRSELALMLWEDADRPMPESALLYPDVGQKEEDMDLQHAARWAMENELLPDLNWDDSRTEEEMKFYPNYAVSRARALHAWRKAQQLKQDA